MGKITLFMRLYRKNLPENIILFIMFSLLAAVVSMVLFVQKNNTFLFQNQIMESGIADEANKNLVMEGFYFAYQSAENILGFIAIAAVLVGGIGGLVLIGFRNQAMEKSLTMMRIFGMSKKDLIVKALIDAAVYALLSTCVGYGIGYVLFIRFVQRILQSDIEITVFSIGAMMILAQTLVLVVLVVFFGNLIIDFYMIEKPIAQILYKRKGNFGKRYYLQLSSFVVLCLVIYMLLVFRVQKDYLLVAGLIICLISGILFWVFHLFFGVFTKKRRTRKKIHSVSDLSFCFLCSRNKRDALLAIIISIGTIILCIITNVQFNIGGILRSAYQDNMGYTILVRVEDFEEKELVQSRLDEEKIGYTYGYSKLMEYSKLNGMEQEDGMFWAFVIEASTDKNLHFYVPGHSFKAENYFAGRCSLTEGDKTTMFGDNVKYAGLLQENQYLSLVSYNFIINRSDWKLGIDDTWSPILLIDATLDEEKEIAQLLDGLACRIESASGLIDELKKIMSDYLEIIALVAGMIILVTATVFYTVIRSDLTKRKTEVYLYRVFGASFGKAQKVIFGEYMLIALISSFAVSFTIMVCGELYFYFGLGKHFPLSIPVVGVTTGMSVMFVFLCCQIAEYMNARNTGQEVLRDE